MIRSPLLEVEDRRLFSPDPEVSSRSSRRSRVGLQLAKLSGPARRKVASWTALQFQYPKYVMVCVRRRRRREVLFAKGKGGGGKRRPRRNHFSDIRC